MNIKNIHIAKHFNKSSTTGKNEFLLMTLFFILKDKIKIVDTLVHIIQLLKPVCHCQKSHIINLANYFRWIFRASKGAMDHEFTLKQKSFLFQQC